MGEITLDHVETNESWKEKNEKWDIAQVWTQCVLYRNTDMTFLITGWYLNW